MRKTKNIIYEYIPFSEVQKKILHLDRANFACKVPFSWYNRYKEQNIIIAKRNNKIIGYFLLVFIKDELYNDLLALVFKGDVLVDPSMFVKNSDYAYISAVVIKKKFRIKFNILMNFVKKTKECYSFDIKNVIAFRYNGVVSYKNLIISKN